MQPEIVVAMITLPSGALIALAQWRTAKSVGKVNGSGSLHEQMADLRLKMAIDDEDRGAGVRRQAKMEKAIDGIKDMVDGIKIHMATVAMDLTAATKINAKHAVDDAATFTRHDAMFEELRSAVTNFRTMIGEPAEGDSPMPLIPYVHEWMHKEANRQAKDSLIPTAQTQVLIEAMDLIKEYQGRLEEGHDQFDRIEANQDIATADRSEVAANLEEAQATVKKVADALAASHVRADAVDDADPPGTAADAGARSDKETS